MKKILSFMTIALWLCSMSTFATTVKAKMPSDWGTTISVWVWPDGGQGTAYPTTKEGDWFVYTSTQSSFNIIFRNGNDWNNGQTVDIKITGDVCLQINEGSGNRTYAVMDCESGEVEPVVTKNIEVRAYSPNAAPHIYWWNCSAVASPAWDARPAMTADAANAGWYSYTFEGMAEAEVLNFNLSSENGQSGDLTATANVCYDARTITAPVIIADCQTPGEGGDEPGGDDPQPVETKSIEIRAYSPDALPSIYYWGADSIADADWNTAPAMTAEAQEGWYSYTFDKVVSSQGINIIFKTKNGQSQDIEAVKESTCYDIRTINPVAVLESCEIEGGDTPQPEHTYYFIGSMLGWDLTKAIPLENGQITKMIEAEDVGEYEFRLLPQNDGWDNGLGFSDINAECSSEGLKAGAEYNNIKAYFGEGEVKVQIVDGKLCITGNFEEPGVEPGDEPGAATWYVYGYINGADYVGTDYPFVDGVATLPELTADAYIYVHKADGTNFNTEGWTSGAETVTMIAGATSPDKLQVPVGTQSIYMCENADGTLKVSRAALDCSAEEPAVEKYCEKATGHQNNPEFADPSGRILLTIAKGEGNNLVVKIKNNNEADNPQTGLNYLWVNAAGSHGVVRYGDGSHDEANVEEVSVVVEFDEPKDSYDFVNIHWAYAGWGGEWAIDGLTITAAELCDGGDEPQPQSAHYLIGNAEVMGSWNIDNALPMENDEIVLNLEAGSYAFKIVATKGWDQPGQLDCNNLAAGQEKLSCLGDVNNISFTMPSAAEVTIKVVENKVYVLGIPDGEIEIPDTHYLIGDADVMGAWQINDAVFMENDEIELTLPAGTYMFKIVATKGWDQPGQLDCSNLAPGQANVGCEGEGTAQKNVKFTLAEEATITIKVENNLIYVLGIPAGGDTPQPQTNYYLIGSMINWSVDDALPMDGDSIVKTIDAEDVGTYQFKILPADKNWDNSLGFTDINTECSSEGLVEGSDNNNIKATFAEGEVKVKVVGGKLCITGNFVEEQVELKNIEIRAYSPDFTPKIHFWGNSGVVGSDWENLPDMNADTEQEGWFSYIIENAVASEGINFLFKNDEAQSADLHTDGDVCYDVRNIAQSALLADCIVGGGGEPAVSYYLIGSMMDWDLANAMLMDGDSIVRMMEEEDFGTYEFKVLPQNTSWDNQLNFSAVNTECSSANIFEGAQDNNIKVAVYDACEWKIKVVNGQLCITGIFIDPSTAPVETKDIAIRAYSPNATPKIHFWGNDSIAGSDWENLPDMIADPENEGWYIYNFTHAVKEQGINFLFKVGDEQSADLHTTGDACYDIRVVAQAEHLQDCQTPVTVEKYCEKAAGHQKNPEFADPSGRILLTIAKGEGNNLVVKIKNNNEAGNPQTGLNYLWVNAAGSHGVVRYGDGSRDEANVEEVSVVVEFDEPKDSYDFVNIHWAYAGWTGEWAIDGLTVTAAELCDGGDAPQPGDHSYTVAGSAAEVFGEAWKPSLTDNDMIKLADDTYAWKKENITLPAGVVQFKVVEDHDWDNGSYPSGDNYSLNIPESGIYVINITFNAESHEITAEATKSGEAVVMPTIQLGGEMTDWDANLMTLTPAQDNLTASVTVPLEAQNYLFKIISGGTWLTKLGESGNYTLHRDWTTADHVNVDVYGNDLLLQADVAGDYTFTWTYADSTLVITFPALAEKYCEKAAGHQKNPEFGDPSGRILLTIAKGEGNNLVVKIKNNNEAGNPQTGLNYLWVNAAGSHGVVRYGDGSRDEANVEEVSVVVEFDEPKDSYDFVNIHWAYAGWGGEWAIDGLTVTAAELCDGGDAPQPGEHTYTVAGSSPEAFGETWNPALEANDMAKQADGTYKWEKENVTLQPGEFKFKVCEDHDWAVSYPAQDYVLPIADAGVYTITIIFDAESKDIVANATKTGEAAVINYYLVGSMQGWNADNAYPMENDELVLTLEANVYQFKIMHADKDWGNLLDFNNINAECSSEGVEDGDNHNVKFTLAQAGEVTVKVVEGQLCVTGDFGGDVVVTVWNVVGDEALFGENWNIDSETTIMTLGEDGKYRYEIESVALVPGEYKWKIVGNHSWDVAQYPLSGDYIINIAEEGNYRIIFTFDLDANAGSEEVTKLEEPVETTYYLAGTFTSWDLAGMTQFVDGVATATLPIDAVEAYQFKVVKAVGNAIKWYGADGTMTADNCTNWELYEETGDVTLTVTESGLYTFNLTIGEQGQVIVSVVYPTGETGIEAIMNAENAPAKFIYNGQLFIRKAGRLFNAQGQLVR